MLHRVALPCMCRQGRCLLCAVSIASLSASQKSSKGEDRTRYTPAPLFPRAPPAHAHALVCTRAAPAVRPLSPQGHPPLQARAEPRGSGGCPGSLEQYRGVAGLPWGQRGQHARHAQRAPPARGAGGAGRGGCGLRARGLAGRRACCGGARAQCSTCALCKDWRCWRPLGLGRPGGERARSRECGAGLRPQRLRAPGRSAPAVSSGSLAAPLEHRKSHSSAPGKADMALVSVLPCAVSRGKPHKCAIRPLARPRRRAFFNLQTAALSLVLSRARIKNYSADSPSACRTRQPLRNTLAIRAVAKL